MKSLNLLFPAVLLASCASTTNPSTSTKFKMADKDSNNLVNRQEAADLIVGDAFKMFDTNGDGVVDLEEFKASGGTEEGFRKLNKSGNGKITLADAQSNPLVVENFTVSFDEADSNKDGNVSYEEYLTYLKRRDAAVR
ncbi:EF-hand domain-containing protein [Haloferula chungangensis]|uniref:EF-hand domain-containing protein n=1 Tax=Haloferula chungangensis TaxID=1048331 RepID=A0ABW2L7H4_9BACT